MWELAGLILVFGMNFEIAEDPVLCEKGKKIL